MAIECVEVQEWIEEEVSGPVEEWVQNTEKKCKELPWWNPLGWLCWLVTFFVKVTIWVVEQVAKWVTRTVCKVVGAVIEFVVGVLVGLWNVVAGIFTLDWQRIVDGLILIATSVIDPVMTVLRVATGLDTLVYVWDEYSRGQLRDHVRGLLEAKYQGETLTELKYMLRVDHGAFGFRTGMLAIRTFLDSETPSPDEPEVPNLVVLHERGDIDLNELCGFEPNDDYFNRKRYKTVKIGLVVAGGGGGEFDNPISQDELDIYLSSRGAEGPPFIVLCMRDAALQAKLRTAELKGRELGLIPSWTEERLEVTLPGHIIHDGRDTGRASESLRGFLLDPVGRANAQVDEVAAREELCTPVAIGIFGYTDRLRGLSACLKGSSCQFVHDASGVTFIDNMPDFAWKYVVIHELGHYFGLCHVDGLDRVMFSGKDNSWFSWAAILNLLLLHGEPGFTLDEAKQAWDYIVEHFTAECLSSGSRRRYALGML